MDIEEEKSQEQKPLLNALDFDENRSQRPKGFGALGAEPQKKKKPMMRGATYAERARSDSLVDASSMLENRSFRVCQMITKNNKKDGFKTNYIQTTKYTLLNFVPKNMLSQFTKLANAYFLMMALLEMVPAISDSGGIPVLMMPLLFVVFVSMIKDAFEDYQRFKSDK